MKKIILTLLSGLFLSIAAPVDSAAKVKPYKFKTQDSDIAYLCAMNDFHYRTINPNGSTLLSASIDRINGSRWIWFYMHHPSADSPERMLRDMIVQQADSTLLIPSSTITLNNGETFLAPMTLFEIDSFVATTTDEGRFGIAINCMDVTSSNYKDLSTMDMLTRSQYFISQLAKYNIHEIQIEGYTFFFSPGFHSAATFKAMFDRLSKKDKRRS